MTDPYDKPHPDDPLETYELAQEEEETSPARPAINPSYVELAKDDETAATQEPEVVDPAQAAARREDQRIRAAYQWGEEDQRKRKITRIVMLSLIGLALIVWLIIRWAGF